MTRRLLHGFCRVAIASSFLASGIEADRPVLTGPTVLRGAQTLQQRSAGPIAFQPTFGDNPRARQRESTNQQRPDRGQPPATVPDLSGRTEQEARELLAKARLRVGDITTVEANIKPGTVLKQDRTPGSAVAVGTLVGFALARPITVVVPDRVGQPAGAPGRGQPPATVPDLSGCTEQEARELLTKARLRVGDITTVEANIKPGTVLKQDRTPGSAVAVGTPCRVRARETDHGGRARFVGQPGSRGRGQPPATVPDLSGRTEQEARELLMKARLRVGDITTVEANIKPGTVLKQDRTPGSPVAVGTPVGFALAIARNHGDRARSVVGACTEQEARELLGRRACVSATSPRSKPTSSRHRAQAGSHARQPGRGGHARRIRARECQSR